MVQLVYRDVRLYPPQKKLATRLDGGKCALLPRGCSLALCLGVVVMWCFIESLCFN